MKYTSGYHRTGGEPMIDAISVDILVVGGGLGGCAAALSATSMGFRVALTEPTDWIGGQLTSQAVPPDEHPWIEQFGCTRRYRYLRNGIRQYYQHHYPLLPDSRIDPYLNPGDGHVSQLCHEPRVALVVLQQMLAFPRSAGRLRSFLRYHPIAVELERDRICAVTIRNERTGFERKITAQYVLDATELGDLLQLAGVEYVTGAESQDETGEPHAVLGPAQPGNVQAITWCFPVAYDPKGEHIIESPSQYEHWRTYIPNLTPDWPGPQLSWTSSDPWTLEPTTHTLLPNDTSDPYSSLWLYRRIISQRHYPLGAMPHEVTLVNWPQNDYMEGNIIDQPKEVVARYLEEARQLSFSLLYWLQTEAPRPDGGVGYPGLHLRPEMVGTDDGLAQHPYIRESRRIKAMTTVSELDIGAEARQGQPATVYDDSVGIGCYRIDLHPSTGGDNFIDIPALPFQIPLGALVPVRVENLLPACKNIGTTHITNGCYRLHPVEWNVGEAAGLLAAFCIERDLLPREVHLRPTYLTEFQKLLRQQGVELHWPAIGTV
jgi:hypothetical protein